ncbi:mitochondrial ribosomal protein S35 [Arctopsyche grandis]|uniref:mitochondrial ribosomal protein S35 n=1 Tax=Arctopsyche grandis TaxID=121162 RepID=UPI00406DA398
MYASVMRCAMLRGAKGATGALGARRFASETSARRSAPLPEDDEFRVLNFNKKRVQLRRPPLKREPIPPPRTQTMSEKQHWPSVWPGPRSFHPASVPLPLRQGYPLKNQAPPGAFCNAELMKIPNFLHLTPPAIKAQCDAIKKFCTPWPVGLETDAKCDEKFPLEVITSDYCHSGPSIRDPLSRIVTIRMKLSKMPLDNHARDKLRRLVGDKYDETTDMLTITSDRCPFKKQNLDFVMYLLTAVYHESWTVESWEAEKTEADMEVYIWDNNASKKSAIFVKTWKPDQVVDLSKDFIDKFDISTIPEMNEYKEAVNDYMNIGENDYQIYKYKNAVLKMLGLPVTEQLVISDSNKS